MQLFYNFIFSNPLLLQSFLLHFCLSPQFIVPAHLLFTLSLRWAQYYNVHVSSTCHLVFVYGIWLLLHWLFYPTSHRVSLSLLFPLALHPHFLAVVCSILIFFCSFFILLPLCPIICKLIVLAFFHPLWHSHSCLCCHDVVTIELLWPRPRDSLILQMGGLVAKSIQCLEWFF